MEYFEQLRKVEESDFVIKKRLNGVDRLAINSLIVQLLNESELEQFGMTLATLEDLNTCTIEVGGTIYIADESDDFADLYNGYGIFSVSASEAGTLILKMVHVDTIDKDPVEVSYFEFS